VEKKEKRRVGIRKATTARFIMTDYKWREIYHAALLETNWSKMEERIQGAEAGLHERKREFALNHGGTPEERQAIEDALNRLGILRKEVATWHESQRAG
jgi:hypothetical protein